MGAELQRLLATAPTDLAFLPRLVVALLLTGLLGWDRERKDRPAGLRTHMLVGISACCFVLLGELFVQSFHHEDPGSLRFDPLRVIEATVAGVSFLGAGTIFVLKKRRVYGLTTAASLLAAAAVGMMVAIGHYVFAFETTLLLFLVVAGLHRLERYAQRGAGSSSGGSAPLPELRSPRSADG